MRAVVVLVAVVALPSCIISVTSRRACSASEPCPSGFSCDGGECIADESLWIGERCSESRQCADAPAVICGTAPSTCRPVCDAMLRPDDACIPGEYCRPEPQPDVAAPPFGTCVESECSTSSDCRWLGEGMSCVPITPVGRACLVRCELTGTGAAYDDTCVGAGAYCQPVGPWGHQSLVCLERVTRVATAPAPGASCDPVSLPCVPGAACVDAGGAAICRAYCDAGRGDADCTEPTAPHCCEVSSGVVPLYAVCQPTAC